MAAIAALCFRLERLAIFLSTNHPDASHQVSCQLAFRFRRRSEKIYFQDGGHGSHLGFPIGMILAIFYLQVTPIVPIKFRVNWPFDSAEDGGHGSYLGFPIGPILAVFDLQVTPILPTKVRANWPFGSREAKIDFQDGLMVDRIFPTDLQLKKGNSPDTEAPFLFGILICVYLMV